MIRTIRRLAPPLVGLVLIAMTACSSKTNSTAGSPPPVSSGAPSSPVPSASGPTVNVISDPTTVGAFNPASITISAGQSVTWVFQTDIPHTVTADDASYTSVQSGLTAGQTFSHTYATPGTYPYHCAIHPQMHGKVIVQ